MLAVLLLCLAPAQTPDQATWKYPLAVAAGSGRVVVADRQWPGVWEVQGESLKELFAASDRFQTPLNAPRCVAVGPDGAVYAGCSSTRQVYRLGDGEPVPLAGTVGEDGNVGIGVPMDIVVTDEGLLVSDLELHRIVRLPAEGGPPTDVAAVRAPRGLFWDEGSLLIVAHGENAVLRLTGDELSAAEPEVLVQGQPFDFAHDIARLGDTLYVTDGYADGVWPVAADGAVGEKLTAEGLTNPVGIAVDGERLLIADPQTPGLWQLEDGQLSRTGP